MTGATTAMKKTTINIKTKTIKIIRESYRIFKPADVNEHYERQDDLSI